MKAAVYYETGAPDVFRYEDVADPQPGPGEILVEIAAVSIEGGDTLNRFAGPMTATPHIVGYQASGTVLALGDGASTVRGRRPRRDGQPQRVTRRAAHRQREHRLGRARRLRSQRSGVHPGAVRDSTRLPVRVRPLQSGETALIHAGAGGVGIAAIQMAKQAGALVLATASSDERLERLKQFGLDDGINYATHDFVAECRRLTGGQGRQRDRRLGRRREPARQPRRAGIPRPVHHGRRPPGRPRRSTSPVCEATTRASPASSSAASCSRAPARMASSPIRSRRLRTAR